MLKIKVLMVGPAPQVMGGISAVVQAYMASDLPDRADLKYLNTHIDGSKLVKFLTAIKAYLKFPVLCFIFKPDVIHIHLSSYFSFYRKLIIFLMTKLLQRKVLIHLHGAYFSSFYESNKIHTFLIRIVFSKADAIVVLSDGWKKWVNSFIDTENIFVLYNPVDASAYKDVMPWENERPDKNILFMGEIGQRKGAYDVIKLVPGIVEIYPDTRFIFAGNGEIEKAKELCEKTGILDKVEFPGWVGPATKKKYYSEACIYLLPSYDEGLPVSVLEAMAAGLPVITTPVGGVPDIVEDGINGFFVQPGDISAMKDRLLLLLSRRDIREKFGRANKSKAKGMFDIKIIVNQLYDIYGILSPGVNGG